MIKVTFTKRFLRGPLRGLDVHDSITFDSPGSYARWIDGMKTKKNLGALDYILCNVEVVTYPDTEWDLVPMDN